MPEAFYVGQMKAFVPEPAERSLTVFDLKAVAVPAPAKSAAGQKSDAASSEGVKK